MRPEKTEIYTITKDAFSTSRSGEGDIIGDCIIENRIGEGGVGVVFRARHIRLQTMRAVKILKEDAEPGLKSRFLREARIAANLHHPNIAGVYNVGEEGGHHYIEMELVEGCSLRQWMEKSGALPIELALSIVLQTGEALAYSQAVSIPGIAEAGIIHRDIKPENILITVDEKVKLVDFGLARPMAAMGETAEGTVVGTFHYMPVEQMEGGRIDARSDVYSLCVLFYELLTGRLPFNGATFASLSRNIREGHFLPPRELNPRIPAALNSVLSKGLSALPADRFDNAEAFCRAIKKIKLKEPASFNKGRYVFFALVMSVMVGGALLYFRGHFKNEVSRPFSSQLAPDPFVANQSPAIKQGYAPQAIPENPPSQTLPKNTGKSGKVLMPPSARALFESEDLIFAEKKLRQMKSSGRHASNGEAAYYLARIQESKFKMGWPGYPDSAVVYWKDFIRDFSKVPGLQILLADAKERLLRLLK